MAAYRTCERELAADYLLDAEAEDLLLYDRGYPAFRLFAFQNAEQCHYCARVRHEFHAEVPAFVAGGVEQRTVTLIPYSTCARKCRDQHLPSNPVQFCLIRVEFESGEVEVPATALLDSKDYPHSAFAKRYALRWGIEDNFQCEKQRMQVENFFSHSRWVLMPDFHAEIFAQKLTAIIATLAQWLADERYPHRQHTYRINFANALSEMKNNLVRLFLHKSPLELCWRLLERMANTVEAARRDRTYPKNSKKVRVPGFQQRYRRAR
jgi:hypothetical protein